MPNKTYQDQLGRQLVFSKTPTRIISLVPSITELLFDLGLGKNVVGRTKFCIHPKQTKDVAKVGGTKHVHMDLIKSLHPDIVIANKEENIKEHVDEISTFCPVWVSNVSSLEDSFSMIKELSVLFEKEAIANDLIQKTRKIIAQQKSKNLISVCYLIWKDPIMVAGGDCYINNVLHSLGYNNVFSNQKRYPTVTLEDIIKKNPTLVLLSSEPYPFKQIELEYFASNIPNATSILVDGEVFSWYGSRILKSHTNLKLS